MKKLLIGLMLTNTSYAANYEEINVICTSMTKVANAAMIGKQMGVPMHQLINNVVGMNVEGDLKEISVAIVRDAYRKPRYYSEDMKDAAISDFMNEVYTVCYDHFDK